MKKLVITLSYVAAASFIGAGIVKISRARTEAAMAECANNLRLIDMCKAQWAAEHYASPDVRPTQDDVEPYIKAGRSSPWPNCPSGGSYTIGQVSEDPTCSIATHTEAFRKLRDDPLQKKQE
jgi:hypothetical protein